MINPTQAIFFSPKFQMSQNLLETAQVKYVDIIICISQQFHVSVFTWTWKQQKSIMYSISLQKFKSYGLMTETNDNNLSRPILQFQRSL